LLQYKDLLTWLLLLLAACCLLLAACCLLLAAAVSNGDNRLLSMIALPEIPTGTVSLKLRNDGKAAVVDAAGKCIVAWGSGPGMQPGC
jgi:hypothetical protein